MAPIFVKRRQSSFACAVALCGALYALMAAVPASLQGAAEDQPAESLPAGVPPADTAPIALMMDMATGQILFQRNIDRRFIPASVTKVMTAFVAFEMMEAGQLTADQLLPVSDESFREWAGTGSTMFLESGAQVSVDDLLRGITTVSANDGAVVLAEGAAGSVDAWVERLNEQAREMGMSDSHFGTPNGWPDAGKTFVSARDLAILGRAMITRHPEKYARYFGQRSFTYNGRTQENYDPISGIVPGGDGIKTGFTRQAGNGFLGSAQRNGNRLLMVIGGVAELDARQRAAREFMEWGFNAFGRRPLFEAGDHIGRVRVRGGDQADVGVTIGQSVTLAQRAGKSNKVLIQVRYAGPVQAPIKAGDPVATLRIDIDGEKGADIPLYAAKDVAKGGALDRLRDGLYTLLP